MKKFSYNSPKIKIKKIKTNFSFFNSRKSDSFNGLSEGVLLADKCSNCANCYCGCGCPSCVCP